MTAALAISIIQMLVKAVPPLVAELRVLFAKGDPTDADWDALKTKVDKPYDQYIAEARGDTPTPPATGG